MNKQLWIQSALEQGWESFEIYQSLQKEKSITWFNGQMDTFTTSKVIGTSLRGVYETNMAYYASEDIQDENREAILFQMRQQAQMITTDQEDQLRNPEPTQEVEDLKTWVQPSMDDIKELMARIEERILSYDSRIAQVASLEWKEGKGVREITNSNGIEIQDEDCIQYFMASVVVSGNDIVKDDYKIQVIQDLKDFDEKAFIKDLCENALFKLNAKPIASQEIPVIFERRAMTSLFGAFTGLFNGELIYKGISPFSQKLDTKVFSDKITIIDNPREKEALQICNYDDEGCPTRKKTLVSKGVFTQMLHSTKSAIQMHSLSTGNGFKSSYSSSVDVQPMNCYIEKGNASLEEMMEHMQEGLVITSLQGLHAGIDFVRADFSLQCSGYLVKNGKKGKAVTMITVAGNYLELMNQIEEVGSDLEWEYHSIVAPSIRFTSCSISGE